jgi:plastocyanin
MAFGLSCHVITSIAGVTDFDRSGGYVASASFKPKRSPMRTVPRNAFATATFAALSVTAALSSMPAPVHATEAATRLSEADQGPRAAFERLDVKRYFERLETVRNAITALPVLPSASTNSTPLQLFEAERSASIEAYRRLAVVFPPEALATEHFELLNIMEGRANVYAWIRNQLGKDASAAEVERAQYRTPEVGQLRRRLEEVDCRLDRVAKANGLGVASFGTNCDVTIPSRQEKVLGSPTAPVSNILLVASGLTTGADGQASPAPDLDFDYSTVYARAGAITLTFDNQNPTPFRHNAVVYRNATGTDLKTSEIVAGTPGGPGPSVNTISFTLDPGEYTIVCNVHLDLHMTRLVVVR